MNDGKDTSYVNSINYQDWVSKITDLVSVMDEAASRNLAARRLRYTEIDIEGERKAGRLAPDELFVPQHIIDTNIRREQSSYVQYITQSPRAVVLVDKDAPANDTSIIERDITNKLRYDGWQIPMYANIDGFQQNGYSVMEVVQDQTKPGEISHECIPFGDFGFISDTRNIQESEMVSRCYYFTKTRLLALCTDLAYEFQIDQVKKIIDAASASTDSSDGSVTDNRDKSLYRIQKVMFRVNGIVHVAWCSKERGDNWVREPRPLVLGRRKLTGQVLPSGLPESVEEQETNYPYFIFPYLISENSVISQLKGRAYLDQDCQEGASSLVSSFCTAHRRAAGLYFSKEVDDPNADIALQKNVFFRTGALINSRIKQFQLAPPSSDVLSAVQAIVVANQNETSQVNFAANNRKDSRKTAKEISTAENQEQKLSTVQVVLYSSTLRGMYQLMTDIIQSRVLAGLIVVAPDVLPYYQRKYIVKPSGDVDVIERQQLITTMMNTWPVMKETPAGVVFLCDLLQKLFPDTATKYCQILQQADAQAKSAQAQQMQQMVGVAKQMGASIVNLSKHPEFFSETGRTHAFPQIEEGARLLQEMESQ